MAEKAAVFIDGGYLNKINVRKYKLDYQKMIDSLLGGMDPNPQVVTALSRLKPVVAQVKPILIFHPSGAAENVQNRCPTHVKNFARGFGMELWRSYYYNCPPYRSSSPSEEDKERYNRTMSFYNRLQKISRMTVRLGKLKFRGDDKVGGPIFEQKQVDLMLGLDIASVCLSGKVELVILLSGDGDMLPAVKTAKDENIIVRLAHGSTDTYDRALWDEADERIELNEAFFQNCLLR